MKTLAIISEYNPFHNGHLYQFYKAKEITGADCILIIMSGNFVQRGEPAIINKFARTDMAISAGADLVIELPFVFSTQDANGFALGSISLLNSLNSVHFLCFGCENNDPNLLMNTGRFLSHENDIFKNLLHHKSKKGVGFPNARAQALCEYHKKHGIDNLKILSNERLNKFLSSPNNILAIEYIKFLFKTKSKIQPIPIKRIGADYHDESIGKIISSASAIRKEIFRTMDFFEKSPDDILSRVPYTMPSSTYRILESEISAGKAPVSLKQYEQYILAELRSISLHKLSQINGINEGLENRIKRAALEATNISDLLSLVKTRRYTLTKIKRILIHVMTNLSREDIDIFNQQGSMYGRVLGFSAKGEKLLKKIKKNSNFPIVTKLSNFLRKVYSEKPLFYETIINMINFDILSGDLYSLGFPKENKRIGRTDFSENIIRK